MKKLNFICSAMLACCLTGAVWADLEPIKGSESERVDSLEKKTEGILAKAGILFGGEFYSRALSSKISGNITKEEGATVGKTTENILFTGVDLSINARPLDAIGGTAIIRMYQDWRNMFGSNANPLTLRWISVDGNVKNIFTYSVGDFKQKYTPFTVWGTDPEIMFEPTIFARQREITMREEFLGDNNRVMQGMNVNFGAKVAPALQELRFNAFFSRLRQAGTEAEISEEGGVLGTPAATDFYGVDMDRYSTALNTDMKFVPGAKIGATILYVGDAKNTSRLSVDETWLAANKDLVFSGRARVGSELFSAIDADVVNFGLSGEFAGSNYTWYEGKDKDKSISGTAFKGNLDGDFKFGVNGLKTNIGFLLNTQTFRNEMAQSPSLFNKSILNTALGKNAFNVFDALYTSVFSYMPGEGEFGVKQPIKKSAWSRSTFTFEELKMAYDLGLIEQSLSGALPFGEATPNRSGLMANLDLDFANKAILVAAKLNVLSEMQRDTTFLDGETTKTTQKFAEFGGGASLDIAKFGNWWAYPFILSGSFTHTIVSDFCGIAGDDNNVSFVNAGLYWKFWKRLALMGGYQLVNSVSTTAYEMTAMQSQWATGLEYTVAEGGVLNATIGQVNMDYTANNKDVNKEIKQDNFSSLRLDLNLTVKF